MKSQLSTDSQFYSMCMRVAITIRKMMGMDKIRRKIPSSLLLNILKINDLCIIPIFCIRFFMKEINPVFMMVTAMKIHTVANGATKGNSIRKIIRFISHPCRVRLRHDHSKIVPFFSTTSDMSDKDK